MRSNWSLILVVAVVLGAFGSAEGAIRFVSASAPAGGNGQTWATAYKYLQDALTAARAPGNGITEIWVAAGTYQPDRDTAHPTGTGDRNATFSLISGVSIRGGFVGNEDPATFDLATRDFVTNPTTLSGDLAGNDGPNFANNAENSYHVITATGATSTAVMDGVHISAGNANSTYYSNWAAEGAGVYCDPGSPTFTDSVFVGNYAVRQGAGYYGRGGSPVFTRCAFTGNSAEYDGGGLYTSSAATLTACTFSGNSSPYGGGVAAEFHESPASLVLTGCTFTSNTSTRGAVYVESGTSSASNCTFVNNAAAGLDLVGTWATVEGCAFSGNTGRGISAVLCDSVTVTGCTFSGNSIPTGFGGAVYSGATNATFDQCTFSGNTGGGGGGGLSVSGAYNTTVSNCKFIGNRCGTSGGGGAISAFAGASALVTNCLLAGNYASYGGGLYSASSNGPNNVTLVNCSLVANVLTGNSVSGGGVYSSGAGTPTLRNCIVWANAGFSIYGSATVQYSCVQGGWPGQGNISADPRLSSVSEHSRLRYGSPCIDAGSNLAVPADITADLAGAPRFVDDPDTPDTGEAGMPARAVVDMGAYEYAPVPAERLYVNASAAPGGDGASWSSGYRYLQDALAAAESRVGILEVWVAGGVYRPDQDEAHPTGTGSRAASFNLPLSVAIYGGFPGQPGQEGDFTVRNPGEYPTDLTGDLAGNDGTSSSNNTENSYHVVKASWTGPSTVLDGFRISGGNANGTAPDDCGAGIYASGVSPTIRNCGFFANAAKANGGGLYAESPAVTNCTFARNSASLGGGMYTTFSTTGALITNCTVVGNTGGGIYNTGAIAAQVTSQVINSIVWANTGSQLTQSNGTLMVMYSCVQGGWSGVGNISGDPKLVFIAGGDLQLRKGSACIDAGLNARVPADVIIDASGAPRFADDPETTDTGAGGGQGGVVDMGAFEYQPGSAKRLYVDAGATGGDGLSQTTAFAHLQDALRLAQSDPNVTEIWVGAGVYRPDRDAAHSVGTGDRAATFAVPGAVRIYGGFPAAVAIDWSLADRDAAANPTILSGDLAGNDGPNFANNGENAYHVVDAGLTTPATLLDGLTIASGNANGPGTAAYGGGMYIASGGPAITGCTFTANAAGSGGGLYVPSSASPVLDGCRFTSNKAASGGGIWNASSAASVMSCTFSGNSATSSGGGFFNSGSAIKLVNGVFSGNSAPSGGAAYSNGGSPALVNCTLSGNSATSAGGAFAGLRATPTCTNCIVWGNTAPSGAQISGAATTTYSCVQGGVTGQGNTSLDPLFVNASAGDLRLSATSPCIDAGSNAAVPGGTLFDASGRVRFMDIPGIADCPYAPGTCGTGAIVDMGAYEFIPTRSVVQWRSVRSHGGAGPLPILLDAFATGQSLTIVTVEDRGVPGTGLGLQLVEVDFDGPVSLASPTDVGATCWATLNGTPGEPSTIVPVVTAIDADTLRFALAGVPDASCVRVQIGAGAINENLTGDADCMIRSLAGDVSGDGQVGLNDLALARTKFGEGAGIEPRCDVTLDGHISLADLSFIKSRMMSPPQVTVCP